MAKKQAPWSFVAEIEEIKTEYSGCVEIGGMEADWRKKRDAAAAKGKYIGHDEPLHFKVRMTKADAVGFGIGTRVRVSIGTP